MSDFSLFEAIRLDHQRQRELMRQLSKTDGMSALRRELYRQLSHELRAHELAEQPCLYTPLFNSGLTRSSASLGVAQHREIDELLRQLDSTDMASPYWLKRARYLFERVLNHIDGEEQHVFELASRVISEQERDGLCDAYLKEMQTQRRLRAA